MDVTGFVSAWLSLSYSQRGEIFREIAAADGSLAALIESELGMIYTDQLDGE